MEMNLKVTVPDELLGTSDPPAWMMKMWGKLAAEQGEILDNVDVTMTMNADHTAEVTWGDSTMYREVWEYDPATDIITCTYHD